jgi:hypothetical protein
MMAADLMLADRTADIDARVTIQGQTVADLDRRIAQIDAAIEESTRLGRPVGAMMIADQKRRDRADIVTSRQREAQTLAGLQIDRARIDAQRRRAETEVGPVRYLAQLIGMPATDLERPVRLLTLALVAVLDPMAVALLLAAGARTMRADHWPMITSKSLLTRRRDIKEIMARHLELSKASEFVHFNGLPTSSRIITGSYAVTLGTPSSAYQGARQHQFTEQPLCDCASGTAATDQNSAGSLQ